MRVVALVPDLMDRSKVASVLPAAVFVSRAADLVAAAEGAHLVLIDLRRPGALDAVAAISATGVATIGFGSHVDRELLEAARSAGCGQVLARSAFFGRLAELAGG
jgi:2-keto-3-deoxy-6-phosphogluconate aldolase